MARKYNIVGTEIGGATAGKILIAGDLTSIFKSVVTAPSATTFSVYGSTNAELDKAYTVLDSTYSSVTDRTSITVDKAITTSVSSGYISDSSVYLIKAGATSAVIDPNENDITSMSVELLGRSSYGWGEAFQQGVASVMCNFSGPQAPANPADGQLWFDTSSNLLKIYIAPTWSIVNQVSGSTNQMSSFTHIQSSASTTWSISHNLNSGNLVWNAYVDVNGVMKPMMPADVTLDTPNMMTLTFTVARSGRVAIVKSAE